METKSNPVYEIPAQKYNELLAIALEKLEEFKMPEWALFVKTSTSKVRPPIDNAWWYNNYVHVPGVGIQTINTCTGYACYRSVFLFPRVALQPFVMKRFTATAKNVVRGIDNIPTELRVEITNYVTAFPGQMLAYYSLSNQASFNYEFLGSATITIPFIRILTGQRNSPKVDPGGQATIEKIVIQGSGTKPAFQGGVWSSA
jgi:hypothetical protein